jgi:DNA-binding NtrC family response regulator
MEHGLFREDLYYRLRVVPIHLPPLRERKDDIPLLVTAFVDRFRDRMAREIESVDGDAMARLLDYDWPGNVRELENAIEHAFVRCRGGQISVEHLPAEIRPASQPAREQEDTEPVPAAPAAPPPVLRYTADDERTIILQALREADGNKSRAARELGVGRTTLWRRMKELGIDWPSRRALFRNRTPET